MGFPSGLGVLWEEGLAAEEQDCNSRNDPYGHNFPQFFCGVRRALGLLGDSAIMVVRSDGYSYLMGSGGSAPLADQTYYLHCKSYQCED